jgi:nucleoid-associated protein YgaU
MRWGNLALLATTAILALGLAAALAQDAEQPSTPAAPAPPSQPAQPAPPAATPASIAEVIDPGLLAELREQYGPTRRGDPGVTGPDNLTVVTVPGGCEVFIAPIADVREARNPDGSEAAVESVVFTADRLLGEAPLTVQLDAGEYVLAVRTYGRVDGFDGSCVRKTMADQITGGVRYTYHLMSLRKREGEYQLYVANFKPAAPEANKAAKPSSTSGVFRFELAALAADLANSTNVPEEQREAIAERLNRNGAAFYGVGGAQYLVKLTLLGAKYHIDEWPVE